MDKGKNKGYEGLAETYKATLGQFENYIGHVLRYIGGTYETYKTSEQPGAVYEPVPLALQKEAMEFLNKHVFTPPIWLLDTVVLSRIGMTSNQVIARSQEMVLSELLSTSTLHEIIGIENMYKYEAYELLDYFNDLDNAIWRELDNFEAVEPYRRTLQRSYAEKLIDLLSPYKAGKGNSDIVPVVKEQLRDLRNRIVPAIRKTKDPITKYHLMHIRDRIDETIPKV